MRVADWYTVGHIRIATNSSLTLTFMSLYGLIYQLTYTFNTYWLKTTEFCEGTPCSLPDVSKEIAWSTSWMEDQSVNEREREREREREKKQTWRASQWKAVENKKLFKWRHIPKDGNLRIHHRERTKSSTSNTILKSRLWIKIEKNGILHSVGIILYTTMRRRLFPCKTQILVDTKVLYWEFRTKYTPLLLIK